VADLAESWTISPDGLTYTLRLRQGVALPRRQRDDVARRQGQLRQDHRASRGRHLDAQGRLPGGGGRRGAGPADGGFRLKWPEASFLVGLASPYNWILKADILAKDIRWYETNVMGTGPFRFVEHVKGSHWMGKRNPDYWDKGRPYLDGYRAIFINSNSAQVAAIRGERAHVQFRGFAPPDRDALVAALGPKITVQESPWDCLSLVTMNQERTALRTTSAFVRA